MSSKETVLERFDEQATKAGKEVNKAGKEVLEAIGAKEPTTFDKVCDSVKDAGHWVGDKAHDGAVKVGLVKE